MGRTTIAIKDSTKRRFIKARGAMEVQNGKSRFDDDVLNELLDFFEKNRGKPDA